MISIQIFSSYSEPVGIIWIDSAMNDLSENCVVVIEMNNFGLDPLVIPLKRFLVPERRLWLNNGHYISSLCLIYRFSRPLNSMPKAVLGSDSLGPHQSGRRRRRKEGGVGGFLIFSLAMNKVKVAAPKCHPSIIPRIKRSVMISL